MVVGRLAARLDGRDAEQVRLPLPAADDRQPDRVVGLQPRRLHRGLAGIDRARADAVPVRPRPATPGHAGSTTSSAGIITWNTPFLFKTRPAGSRLLVIGPANQFKHGVQPLTARHRDRLDEHVVHDELEVHRPQRPGPIRGGRAALPGHPDRRQRLRRPRGRRVTYTKLWENAEVSKAYHEWHNARQMFHQQKARGEVKPDDWQKDYFQGRDAGGREAAARPHDQGQAAKDPLQEPAPLGEDVLSRRLASCRCRRPTRSAARYTRCAGCRERGFNPQVLWQH